mgnify:FL=1
MTSPSFCFADALQCLRADLLNTQMISRIDERHLWMILFVLDSIIFELLRIPFTLCHDSFLHLLYIMLYEKVIFKASYLYASTKMTKGHARLYVPKACI